MSHTLSRLRRALCIWRCAQCRKRTPDSDCNVNDPSGGAE